MVMRICNICLKQVRDEIVSFKFRKYVVKSIIFIKSLFSFTFTIFAHLFWLNEKQFLNNYNLYEHYPNQSHLYTYIIKNHILCASKDIYLIY